MHFAENIGIADALLISLFSIIFVFALLYIISLVISLISVVCKKKNTGSSPAVSKKSNVPADDNDEIVAIITAALMAHNDGREVSIKSIKDTSSELWIKNSRIESQN